MTLPIARRILVLKDAIVKMTIKVALVIFGIVTVVLAAISFIDYSYLLGWLVGAMASMSSYFLGILLINRMQTKAKTKKSGFWLGFARSWIQMAFHAVIIFVMIIIDMEANGYAPFKGGMDTVLSPINIIAYIFGVGLITLSTLIAHILIKKRR